jgi:serine/threonine-protein kinase RsbW
VDKLSVVVPCDMRFRDPVGALLQLLCQPLGADGETLGYQVVSAFNEAFNNLSQYAYPDRAGDVEIQVELRSDRLIIELHDDGERFDFDEVEAPDLGEMPESGLGIFIMRSFMSEVCYQPGGEKNVLRMERRLDDETGEP